MNTSVLDKGKSDKLAASLISILQRAVAIKKRGTIDGTWCSAEDKTFLEDQE